MYDDNGQVLRPCDLVCNNPGTEFILLHDNDIDTVDPTWQSTNPSKQNSLFISTWSGLQQRLQTFWDIWTTDYLQELKERYIASHKTPRVHITDLPKIDRIVLIYDTNTKRSQWRIGKITKLNKSKDDSIRSCDVKLTNGNTIQRAVSHLYPIELDPSVPTQTSAEPPVATELSTHKSHIQPVRRSARLNAKLSPITLTVIMLCILFSGNTAQPTSISYASTVLTASLISVSIGIPIPEQTHETYYWTVANFSQHLPANDIRRAFTEATKIWSDATNIKFIEVWPYDPYANIRIIFGTKHHGDAWPFQGEGYTLAHVTNYEIHYDDDEQWYVMGSHHRPFTNYNHLTDLVYVSIHEIGHILGYAHSPDPNSVMYPYYNGYIDEKGNIKPTKIGNLKVTANNHTVTQPLIKLHRYALNPSQTELFSAIYLSLTVIYHHIVDVNSRVKHSSKNHRILYYMPITVNQMVWYCTIYPILYAVEYSHVTTTT